MRLHVATLYCLIFLTTWTLVTSGQPISRPPEKPTPKRIILDILAEMVSISSRSLEEHKNATMAVLKSFGLKSGTVEIVTSIIQSMASLVRPLAKPLFRGAGMLLVAFQVCKSLFPSSLGLLLPSSPYLTGVLGDAAAEMGMGALAEQLHFHNVAGQSYSATWVTWMESCQSRALCDLGQFLGHAAPLLAPFVDLIGPPLGFSGQLLQHIKSGLDTDGSCGDIYLNCPHVTEYSFY